MRLRLKPRDDRFFGLFSVAGDNISSAVAILREFVCAPVEDRAELARRMHDAEHAGDEAIPDEHPAFACAFEVLANGFSAAVTAHDLPALRLSTGSTQWTVGEGDPVATVTANRIDLYRSIAGRRTHEQITALDWDRDSHRWLPAFTWGPFTPPDSPTEPTAR